MKGLQLFLHSVRQVFGNFGAAVRISGLLYLVQIVAAVLVRGVGMGAAGGMGRGPGGGVLLLLAVTLVTGLWIAVAWHRYVLRVEEPTSIVPEFHGRQLLSYLGRSLLIGVILVVPAALLATLAGIVFKAFAPGLGIGASFVASLIVLVPIILVTLRLSPMLPAAALGEKLGIRDAWTSTEGATTEFLGLALIASVASFLIDLPLFVLMNVVPVAMLWAFAAAWVKMMVGASVLTTVYGHYIEKRPLAA